MQSHWVVVADGGQARFFSAGEMLDRVEPVEELRNRGRPHPQRVWVADRRGRPREPGAWEGRDDVAFARRVGDRLLQGIERGEFDWLVVVAPPRFMEHLREQCAGRVAERVIGEVVRNLTWVPDDALADRVRDHLEAALPGLA